MFISYIDVRPMPFIWIFPLYMENGMENKHSRDNDKR